MTTSPDAPGAVEKAPWRYREKEPYQPGNFAAVKHGAYSPRLISARAEQILVDLREEGCPWLDDIDALALDVWAKARARYDLLDKGVIDIIMERGVEGVGRHLWEAVTSQERNVMRLTQDLGLDPTGRARLLKDLGLAKQYMRDGAQALSAKGGEIRRLRALDAAGSRPPEQ